MKTIEIQEFFLTPNGSSMLQHMYSLSDIHTSTVLLKELRYSFEEAQHTLGLQEMEDIQWIISPATILITGLQGDPGFPSSVSQSVDNYATAFCRPRTDGQIVIYVGGYEGPIHISTNENQPIQEEWGTPRGLVRGIVRLAQDMGYQLPGFDGYLDIPFQPGRGLSSSSVFSSLILKALVPELDFKVIPFLKDLVNKYQLIEQSFHGSTPLPLPFATGLSGGTLGRNSQNSIEVIENREDRWILGDLPLGISLQIPDSSPAGTADSHLNLDELVPQLFQSRKKWQIGKENTEFFESLEAKSKSVFGKTPLLLPYGTSLLEIRSFLAYFPPDYLDPRKWAEEMGQTRCMILKSEGRGTRIIPSFTD